MSESKPKPSEVVKTSEGRQYYTVLMPGDLANYIMLCVDPVRATGGRPFFRVFSRSPAACRWASANLSEA
jgi:hypothetical protein